MTWSSATAAILALAAAVGVVAGASGETMLLLAGPFLAAAPGLAWMSTMGRMRTAEMIVCAVALTIALEIALAAVLVVSGSWDPMLGFTVLVAMTVLGIIVSLLASWPHAGSPAEARRNRRH